MKIIYHGLVHHNKIPFLVLVNEQEEKVEIPIDLVLADRIVKYIAKIAKPPVELVEETESNDLSD